jgi:hypothetical protein
MAYIKILKTPRTGDDVEKLEFLFLNFWECKMVYPENSLAVKP